jgi:hypothetical protein
MLHRLRRAMPEGNGAESISACLGFRLEHNRFFYLGNKGMQNENVKKGEQDALPKYR